MAGLGLESTEENKKNWKKVMEGMNAKQKTKRLKGSSTEFHECVQSPELDENDFKYSLPKGTVIKDSLLVGRNRPDLVNFLESPVRVASICVPRPDESSDQTYRFS